MAEVNAQARPRPEPPARTRNRRALLKQRRAAARTTGEDLKAAISYFWGTFADYAPSEIDQVCEGLVAFTDSERRRLRGS